MHSVVMCGGVSFSFSPIQISAATDAPDDATHSPDAASGLLAHAPLPSSTSQLPLEVSYSVAIHLWLLNICHPPPSLTATSASFHNTGSTGAIWG